MYTSYVLSLPGGFQLPISIEKVTTISYECQDDILPENTVCAVIENYAQMYLRNQMVAGNILHSSNVISINNSLLEFHGQYLCREMIGKVYEEEIVTVDE